MVEITDILKIKDGTEGAGKILRCGVDGQTIWQDLSASSFPSAETEEIDLANFVTRAQYYALVNRIVAIQRGPLYLLPQNLIKYSEKLYPFQIPGPDNTSVTVDEWFRSSHDSNNIPTMVRAHTSAVTPPDGIADVTHLTAASGSFGGILQTAYYPSIEEMANPNKEFNWSGFLKMDNHRYFIISVGGNPVELGVQARIDLQSKTAIMLIGDGQVNINTDYPDDWVRIDLQFKGLVPQGTATGVANHTAPGYTLLNFVFTDGNGDPEYSLAGTEKVYATGMQFSRDALRVYTKTENTEIQ